MEPNKAQIINQFKCQGISILDSWITTQLGIFPNYNYQKIYDLFLKTDIAMSCSSVPADFIDRWGMESRGKIHKENVFEQGVVLQITEIMDVSKSISRQIDIATGVLVEEDFEKEMNENSFSAATKTSQAKKKPNKKQNDNGYHNDYFPGSRTLRITMSDGKHLFTGCEYQPIPFLKTETPLGCKVRIKGPLVLRGVMMLDSKNLQLLGGTVPELNLKTSLERLEDKLKLLNGTPQTATSNYSSNVNNNQSGKRTRSFDVPEQKRKATIKSKETVSSNNIPVNSNQAPSVTIPEPNRNFSTSNDPIDLLDDSDFFIDDDLLAQANSLGKSDPCPPQTINQGQPVIEILSSGDSPKEISVSPRPKTSNYTKTEPILTPDDFSDYDFDDFMN